MNNQGPNDSNQFVVSYELLQLFRWLFEHEQETLKKVMARALKNGLQEQLYSHLKSAEAESTEELQQSIVDFFALLETLLYELINENEVKRIMQRNILPAIDHIDAAACDNSTVALSIAKATSLCENDPRKDPKEILFKELLKRWKPAKKLSHN